MSAAQALTSLRSKHLRTIEVLKETTTELDILKKKFGNRGNYIDEDERERIKENVRKSCNEELRKMQMELMNAQQTIKSLKKEKQVADERFKQLEDSTEQKLKAMAAERDNSIKSVHKLENDITLLNEEYSTKIREMNEAIQAEIEEKKNISERLLEADKKMGVQREENERLGGIIESLNAKLREFDQSSKNQKDLLKKTKSMESMFKKLESRASECAAENKDLAEKLRETERKLEASEEKSLSLEKSKAQLNKALENAKSECNRLNNVYVGEIEKKEFLEKSLAVAKAEWERLVQENARLTDELELLKASTSNNSSRFAQFVELKEENSNLARKHNKLQKKHEKLKKVTKKAGVLLRQQMPQTETRYGGSSGSIRRPQPPMNAQLRQGSYSLNTGPYNTSRDGSR
eukprot:g11083.t1